MLIINLEIHKTNLEIHYFTYELASLHKTFNPMCFDKKKKTLECMCDPFISNLCRIFDLSRRCPISETINIHIISRGILSSHSTYTSIYKFVVKIGCSKYFFLMLSHSCKTIWHLKSTDQATLNKQTVFIKQIKNYKPIISLNSKPM